MAFNPVAVILRATQIVRGWGVTVTFEPGWETRGNGYRSNWVGFLEHHTGTPWSSTTGFPTRRLLREGRSDLSGPLCNSAGPKDGSIHVMAAQAANHAGASGGRSMGPLPVTTLFNPRVFGHEVDYPGSSPMTDAQYRASVLWARAVLIALAEAGQIGRFDAERARLHAETSITGKWDAGYKPGVPIDAAAMRRAISTPPARPEEDDMQLTDPWDEKAITARPGSVGHALLNMKQNIAAARAISARTEGKVAGLMQAFSDAAAGREVDLAAVEAAAERGTNRALAEGTVDVDITVGGKEVQN